jgi:protein-tyrosine phosphatase
MPDSHTGPLPGSYWVRAGRLLAGPHPGSSDPDIMRDRINRLRAVGVTFFVDLTQAGEREDYSPLLPEGVQYHRFAIRDFTAPSRETVIEVLNAIDAALAEGQTVYVHCWGGIGRTGTIIGCFLVRQGLTGEEALAEIARLYHSGSPETDDQRALVRDWPRLERSANMADDYSEALPHGMYWVQPGQLMAGPHPGAWDENQARQRLRRLLDLGVTFFVDLTEPNETQSYDLLLSTEAAALNRDVTYRQLAIQDMDIPDQSRMVAILDTIDMAIRRGYVVYVHCLAGLGRTGTVVGCYLVRHGLSGDDALAEIARLRGGRSDSPQTDEQCYMVSTWHEDK